MSLTKVIVKEEESAAVVDHMLRRRETIAVDMEGVASTPTGLVQIRIRDGPIYVFRTGYNPRLLHEGKLKELLQSADVLKVMHASTSDCIGIGADGVRMWGLYDTALAENVILHQNGVENVQFGSFTSYNNLCAKYGLVVNPLKQKYFGHTTFKEERTFQESKIIPEDLVFYSACDVYALHDLYDAVDSQIEPDFRPILNDLCEMELLRGIDNDLVAVRKHRLKKLLNSTLLLRGFNHGLTKADIYALLAGFDGYRKVLLSPDSRCAHVLMASRNEAISAFFHFNTKGYQFPSWFGGNAKASLVKELSAEEAFVAKGHLEKCEKFLLSEDFIVDEQVSANVVEDILAAKCPVVCDFQTREQGVTTMTMFAGAYPVVKIGLTQSVMASGRMGELFASPNVEKVVARIDNCYWPVRACAALGLRPQNFFDISTACKMADYEQFGKSIYNSPTETLGTMFERHGLTVDNSRKLEHIRYLHIYLKNSLSPPILEMMSEKSQVDLDVLSQIELAEAKGKRKLLKELIDWRCIHVTVERGDSRNLKETLEEYLEQSGISYERVILLGHRRVALVTVAFHPHVAKIVADLPRKRFANGLVLSAKSVEKTVSEGKARRSDIPLAALRQELESNAAALEQTGFFKAMSSRGFRKSFGKPLVANTFSNPKDVCAVASRDANDEI